MLDRACLERAGCQSEHHTTFCCTRVYVGACDSSRRIWSTWASKSMGRWAASVRAMLGSQCNATALPYTGAPLYVLRYEEVVNDPEDSLTSLLTFLGEWLIWVVAQIAEEAVGAVGI
jgi:hypothetical protein